MSSRRKRRFALTILANLGVALTAGGALFPLSSNSITPGKLILAFYAILFGIVFMAFSIKLYD